MELNPHWLSVASMWLKPIALFITRLHVRYNRDKFPEDLKFQSTSDRHNFQGRYIIRHPFVQEDPDQQYCSQNPGSYRRAYLRYRLKLPSRRKKNAQTLADLTDWNIAEIRQKMAQYKSE